MVKNEVTRFYGSRCRYYLNLSDSETLSHLQGVWIDVQNRSLKAWSCTWTQYEMTRPYA